MKTIHRPFTLAIALLSGTALADKAQHSIGIEFQSFGLGTSYTYKLSDTLQIRTHIAGISSDKAESDFNHNQYKGELNLFATASNVDWYPVAEGWASSIFYSAGLRYASFEFSGDANLRKNPSIGGTVISRGDIDALTLDIEKNKVAPAISAGWGNKINGTGFSFKGELGIVYLGDADVKLTAKDSNSFLADDAIDREVTAIEDDFGNVGLFASVGVHYHF